MKEYSLLHNASTVKREPILIAGPACPDRDSVNALLANEGFIDISVVHPDEYNEYLSEHPVSLMIIVCQCGKKNIELLSQIKNRYPHLPVIIITDAADTASVVEMVRHGAYDLMGNPLDDKRLIMSIARGIERKMLLDAIDNAQQSNAPSNIKNPTAFSHIVTGNSKMISLFSYLETTIRSNHPILITGETGVGKELFARAVYYLSGADTYTTVNIAGLDDTVFSDTLFGHKKGAFTGAEHARDGLIAKAADGVLLLDEIGDLTDQSQVKLLRLIQEGTYYPLGSDILSHMKARLILATNKNLEEEVEKGRFRKDLFFRIRTHHIEIPPLREHIDDIPLLLSHFVRKASVALGKQPPPIPPEMISFLSSYNFPGNTRELEAMVNNAVAVHKRGPLSLSAFQGKMTIGYEIVSKSMLDELSVQHFPTLKDGEEFLIEKAMSLAGGNQRVAATMLGISRQALNKRLLNKRKER